MVSIFSAFDFSDYWVEYSISNFENIGETLYSGSLQSTAASTSSSLNYNLTPSCLIQLDSQNNPQRLSYINWKLLKAFTESTPEGEIYGFSLGSEDFYVASEELLNAWLFWLRKLCICSMFEEDFVVIKEVGKGSTCKVYLIEDLLTKKQFAAKCIEKMYISEHAHGMVNLIQEVKVLSSVHHSQIAELHYVYETDNCIYLVMEYFESGDFYTRIKEKKMLSEEDCLKFAVNLLEVLDYLHTNNIVHRDLKLENIMMTSKNDFDFKLVDFGLAYECTGFRQEKCGSPGYIAPEMLKRCKYNSKIDIFSAGVVLYTAIVGRHPFNASKSEKILKKNKDCIYKPENILGDLARDFITSMMNPEPSQRPTASQLFDYPWVSAKKKNSSNLLISTFSTRGGSVILDV